MSASDGNENQIQKIIHVYCIYSEIDIFLVLFFLIMFHGMAAVTDILGSQSAKFSDELFNCVIQRK